MATRFRPLRFPVTLHPQESDDVQGVSMSSRNEKLYEEVKRRMGLPEGTLRARSESTGVVNDCALGTSTTPRAPACSPPEQPSGKSGSGIAESADKWSSMSTKEGEVAALLRSLQHPPAPAPAAFMPHQHRQMTQGSMLNLAHQLPSLSFTESMQLSHQLCNAEAARRHQAAAVAPQDAAARALQDALSLLLDPQHQCNAMNQRHRSELIELMSRTTTGARSHDALASEFLRLVRQENTF